MKRKMLMTKGTKHDGDKIQMDLLPPLALEATAAVLTFGATKYARGNFLKGIDYSRLYAATQRHLNAWAKGETLDHESGITHLAHAVADLMMLIHFEATNQTHLDDSLYKKESYNDESNKLPA